MTMLPGQLPQWLDYALSENTAAAMFRGLQGLSARWGELIAAAQAVMGSYQDLPVGSIEQLYDEQNALPLIAAIDLKRKIFWGTEKLLIPFEDGLT